MKSRRIKNKNKGVSLNQMFFNGNRHQRRAALKIAKKLRNKKYGKSNQI